MLLPSARLKREYASVTAAYRRIDVAMQIAGFVWRAMPRHRPAAARKITNSATFGLGTQRTIEPRHHPERLIIFLNPGFHPADVTLLGAKPSARLLG